MASMQISKYRKVFRKKKVENYQYATKLFQPYSRKGEEVGGGGAGVWTIEKRELVWELGNKHK